MASPMLVSLISEGESITLDRPDETSEFVDPFVDFLFTRTLMPGSTTNLYIGMARLLKRYECTPCLNALASEVVAHRPGQGISTVCGFILASLADSPLIAQLALIYDEVQLGILRKEGNNVKPCAGVIADRESMDPTTWPLSFFKSTDANYSWALMQVVARNPQNPPPGRNMVRYDGFEYFLNVARSGESAKRRQGSELTITDQSGWV